MPSDSKEFKQLEKRIWALLTVRQIVWWSAWWFFALGLTVLLVRILTWWPTHYLVAAIAGVLPVAVALGIWRWKHRPDRVAIQALLDRENRAGGLIMASEQVETSDWKRESGELTIPQFRWRSNRGMMVFASAAVFLGIAILLPEKHLGLAARRSLEVGQLVSEIADEIKLLDEEEILEEDKANELTKELARLEKDASGNDPAKTWEALDHLKESNSELAKQAAEEALKKLDALKKSETLAGAVGIMPEPNDAAESRAM